MLSYKDFSLIKPNQEQSKAILNLINTENGSIFHEFILNKIISTEFGTDLYYLVDNVTNIQNFCPVHVTKSKTIQKRYELKPLFDVPYAGFLNEDKIDFNKLKCGIFDSIVYAGTPNINLDKNDTKITFKGETCLVDLNNSEEDIFNNIIHSKRRNMIRKADKSAIEVKTYFTAEGLDYFWPILSKLHDKLGCSHLTRELYEKLINSYGSKQQAFIIVAFKENIPISGVFILGNKNYMIYYKGASSFGVKNEGQGERLQWEAIKVAKSLGAKYYDLCNLNKQELPHIYKFKTGISNNIVLYSKFRKNNLGYKLLNKFN